MADKDVDVPTGIREIAGIYLQHIDTLTAKIKELSLRLQEAMAVSAELRRLCTVPGIEPVTAGATMAFAPDLRTFDNGRNFTAWLNLVPKQRSTGGKPRLESMNNMG